MAQSGPPIVGAYINAEDRIGGGLLVRTRNGCGVITANHVIDGGSNLTVTTTDGRRWAARRSAFAPDGDGDAALAVPTDFETTKAQTCIDLPSRDAITTALQGRGAVLLVTLESGGTDPVPVDIIRAGAQIQIKASDPARPLNLGFSGSPVIINNVPVAIFQSINENLPGTPGIATRIDRIVSQIGSPDLVYDSAPSPIAGLANSKQIESPSKLHAYDSTNPVKEGIPAEGQSYKYTPFGCDWRATTAGEFVCSIWIEADSDLLLSRMTNQPRLEMSNGKLISAASVDFTSDTTGRGYQGTVIGSYDFSNTAVKGFQIEARLARKSVLLQIHFPTTDVANTRAILFSLGANDQIKRIPIVPVAPIKNLRRSQATVWPTDLPLVSDSGEGAPIKDDIIYSPDIDALLLAAWHLEHEPSDFSAVANLSCYVARDLRPSRCTVVSESYKGFGALAGSYAEKIMLRELDTWGHPWTGRTLRFPISLSGDRETMAELQRSKAPLSPPPPMPTPVDRKRAVPAAK
jgi:hypothetical protein